MTGLWPDLASGLRTHLKTPVVTAMAVLTLAFGIAANNLAFSLVNSFFLRPLPVSEPRGLVRIYTSFARGMQHFTLSYPDYADIRGLHGVFSGVVVENPVPFAVSLAGGNERIWGYTVSGGYFSVLGVRPAAGRFFTPEEEHPHADGSVVVLSYGLWQRVFGESPGVLGGTIVLNGEPCRVIGVAPQGFQGVNLGLRPELWRAAVGDELERREGRAFFAIGRLKPGVTLDQARAAVDVLARQLQHSYPDANEGVRFALLPEAEGRVHPMARAGLLGFSGALAAVAALVLLLACANAAGILLVRALSRRREIGVRLALGASRGRIVRMLLAESAVLLVPAGALGLATAWVATRMLSAIRVPTRIPLFFDLGLDARGLGFSLAVTLAAGVLFGLVPAFEGSRADLVTVLKDAPGPGGRPSRMRGALVAGQVALAMVLLIGGGLFLRSLQNASRVDLGFDPRGVATASLDLGLHGYARDEARQFFARLTDRIAALPGAESVSLASTVPFELNITTVSMAPEGDRPPAESGWPSIDWAVVDASYFRTMRIPLVDGREFSDRDTDASPAVAIVNDVLAEQFWPGTRAVGRRLTTREGGVSEVIGVAKRAKQLTLGEAPKPYVYFPFRQGDFRAMAVLVRSAGHPASLLRDVREAVRALDTTVPLYKVTTMAAYVEVALAPARGGAAALTIIGMVALLLASLGLYGTLAQTVGRRTFEIGVRRALGARDGDVVRLVVGQALGLVLGGLAAGVGLGLGGSRLVQSVLYGVEATDSLVFAVAPLVMVAVCVAAAWVPAARAVRVDPGRALRCE